MKRFLLAFVLVSALAACSRNARDESGQVPDSVPRDGRTIVCGETFLRQQQPRDSVLIGDQLSYGVRLDNVLPGTSLSLPELRPLLGDSVELVKPWVVDTLGRKARKGRPASADLEISALITSFEEGDYLLPPVALIRERGGVADTLLFSPSRLTVKTLPVDTASFIVHDLKPVSTYPLTVAEIVPFAGIGAGILLLVAVLLFLLHRFSPSVREQQKPEDPAHIVALRRLDGLRGPRYLKPERQKALYSGVTDALREYIAGTNGIPAQEMTTAEIFSALRDVDIPMKEELRELFEESDFVKFAKLTVPEEQAAKAVPTAVNFVTLTYSRRLEGPEDNTAV